MEKPAVSAVITTLNEEHFLEPCLRHLRNQKNYKDMEIIVTDSNSKDRTVEIAKKYADVVINKSSTITRGRNSGAKVAHGDVLLFIDADVSLCNNWVEIILPRLYDEGTVAAYGNLFPKERSFKSLMIYSFEDISNKVGPAIGKSNFAKLGTAVAIRKEAFDKVGGYDNSLTFCDDLDLSMRLSQIGDVRYVKDAMGYVSMRRFIRTGYLKLTYTWVLNSLLFAFAHKQPSFIYTRDYP